MAEYKEITPFATVHPMVHVHDEVRYRRMSCKYLARRMKMTKADVRRMFNQFWDITPEIAVGLERALGISAESWIRGQKLFERDCKIYAKRGWGQIIKSYK